jgi:hypothetical protein
MVPSVTPVPGLINAARSEIFWFMAMMKIAAASMPRALGYLTAQECGKLLGIVEV